MKHDYKFPMKLTQQMRFCGNPFRLDTYAGCEHGCVYCFANTRKGAGHERRAELRSTQVQEVGAIFRVARRGGGGINGECIRHRVPLHLGGMSDPFQPAEFSRMGGVTKSVLDLLRLQKYPMMISTKTGHIPEEYFALMSPDHVAFQCSLVGTDAAWLKRYETGTMTPQERIEFMRDLKSRGYWVGLRIQPLIDLDQALSVVDELVDTVDYITVEHMKLPADNPVTLKLLTEDIPDFKAMWHKPKQGRNFEVRRTFKLANIAAIKERVAGRVPIGVGDNDCHELTETRNCCGMDTCGPAFDGWLRYNYTYLTTGDLNESEVWCPKLTGRDVFQHRTYRDDLDYRGIVDDYMTEYERKMGRVQMSLAEGVEDDITMDDEESD